MNRQFRFRLAARLVLAAFLLLSGLGLRAAHASQDQVSQTSTPTESLTVAVTATLLPTTQTPSLTPTSSPAVIETSEAQPEATPIATLATSETITVTPLATPISTLPLTAMGTLTSTLTPTSTSTLMSTATNTPLSEHCDPDVCMPQEVLLQAAPSASLSDLSNTLAGLGVDVLSDIDELGVIRVHLPDGDVGGWVKRLEALPQVEHAEPNYVAFTLDTLPNDPSWGSQYGLLAIRAPQGWDYSTGAAVVTIAILDTGVDQTHGDLSAKIVPGFDFVEMDADPQDDNGHGTHVAGIAAAISNNGTGVAGVSWGAQIMPVKVLNRYGGGSYADVAAGIVWAVDHGAHVINMSFGGSFPSTVLADAVNYAYASGVVQVSASGNSGSGVILYPARYDHVIAVGATDAGNNRASFSNYGGELELAAPGVSIYSTLPGNGYGYHSGTSMAAPFVSGLAAILVGMPRLYSPDLIAYEMEFTALDLGTPGRDPYFGYGLIQMDAAIRQALPTATPVPLPRPTRTLTPAPTSAPALIFWTLAPTYPSTMTDLPVAEPLITITSSPSPATDEGEATAIGVIPAPTSTVTMENIVETTPLKEPQRPALPWIALCGGALMLAGVFLLAYAVLLRRINGEESQQGGNR